MRITRGINDPVVSYRFMLSFEPREVFNLSGRDVYLIIAWRGLTIEKNSIANSDVMVVSPNDGEVTWRPTIAETLLLPMGRIAKYRFEWRQASTGLQGLLASGSVHVGDGSPDAT
jgi:phosphoribosylpyrophosphate synthetase